MEVLEVSVGRWREGTEESQSQDAASLKAGQHHFSLHSLQQQLWIEVLEV